MEHERQPLSRGQGIEHDQQSKADRVRQQRLLLRLKALVWADEGVGQVHPQGFLAPQVARAQHVQAHPGDDRRQPSAEVVHLACPQPAEAQPGDLNGVVGLGERAQHPVGNRSQMGPVLVEAVRQQLVLVHRSHPRVARCHTSDPHNTTDVTRRHASRN